MTCPSDSILVPLLAEFRRHADALDHSGDWPGADLQTLNEAGLFRWAVPREFGGLGVSPLRQHLAYEEIARASLSLSLIVSQRDAAVGLIEAGGGPDAGGILRRMAEGDVFATVGIAQLTTSRQGGAPALRAVRETGGYRLDGTIPWCTGAAKAQFIVAGAADEAGKHLLFLLPTDAPGVSIAPPLPLSALRSTWTTSVELKNVRLEDSALLRGPEEKVLGRRNHLPLGQAFLATGLARGALDLIRDHDSPAARQAFERFDLQLADLRRRIIALSERDLDAQAAAAAPGLRAESADLAVRAAHAAVALYKGNALLVTHPAQRLAREAMFLLVWSCPGSVIDRTVELLSEPRGKSIHD